MAASGAKAVLGTSTILPRPLSQTLAHDRPNRITYRRSRPLTSAVPVLIVGSQDADKIGHAGSILVFGRNRILSVGCGLARLPNPGEEIDDFFHRGISMGVKQKSESRRRPIALRRKFNCKIVRSRCWWPVKGGHPDRATWSLIAKAVHRRNRLCGWVPTRWTPSHIL